MPCRACCQAERHYIMAQRYYTLQVNEVAFKHAEIRCEERAPAVAHRCGWRSGPPGPGGRRGLIACRYGRPHAHRGVIRCLTVRLQTRSDPNQASTTPCADHQHPYHPTYSLCMTESKTSPHYLQQRTAVQMHLRKLQWWRCRWPFFARMYLS